MIENVIASRRSVRSFKPDPIPLEVRDKILDAGRRAPSAVNYQPWHFIVLIGDDIKKMSEVYSREWFLAAPLVIVVCIDHDLCWKRKDGKDFGDVDAAIAMDHMILQAEELGVGSCWIGAFDESAARDVLALPDHIEPVVMTPLGYPADNAERTKRKEISQIVHFGSFTNNSQSL